jgi:hypothetical protein
LPRVPCELAGLGSRSTVSTHCFTPPQVCALRWLTRDEDWTFRATEVRLAEPRELRAALGVQGVPEYTTR